MCTKLIETMPKKVNDIIKAKGRYTIDAAQIQNNLGFGIWHLNLGFGT
jgi:hypothetical protein